MTSKELLYVEDALGHEQFMKNCSKITSTQIKDISLGTYIKELEERNAQLEMENDLLKKLRALVQQRNKQQDEKK